jgi:tetratricopeptide (TPR) repeat protein
MRISSFSAGLILGLGALVALGTVVATERAATAQAKPDFEAAKKHYKNAKDAEKRGDYDTAIAEFAAAYDITKDPKILYSIGRAYESSGNKDAAVVYYRRYITEAKDAKDRDEVKARIDDLEGKGAGTTDGGTIGGGSDTGGGTSGGGSDTGGGTSGGGTSGGSGNDLVTPDLGGGGDDTDPGGGGGPSFVEGGSRWQRTAGWVSIGIAAVALTTGAVLGESAASAEEDINRLVDYRDDMRRPTTFTGTVREDYNDAKADGARDEKLAIVAFSLAGAAAVAATVFFIMDPGPQEEGASARAPARSKVAKRRVTPLVAPGSIGVQAGWSF